MKREANHYQRLYLIGLGKTHVKLGRTRDVAYRMNQHRSDYGHDAVTWVHLFQPLRHIGYEVEEAALARLAAIGKRNGFLRPLAFEEFSGISKEQAIAAVREVIAEAIARPESNSTSWARFVAAHLPFLHGTSREAA